MSKGDVRELEPMQPIAYTQVEQTAPTSGAIWSDGGGTMNLFGDRKARNVGDLLTVVLTERTTAPTNNATTVNKNSETSTGASSLLGAPLTLNGRNLLENDFGSERNFTGDGASSQSNKLEGSVTVTVIQRLPNGNLLVQGTKRVKLNQGDEVVQLQGIVRTADIRPDNTVLSERVGEARILYGGHGPIARSNVMGWLDRFFNSAWYPN